MRISTSMMFQAGSSRISNLQASTAKTQEQIAANTRLLTPSDDPIASARVLEIAQSQSINTQLATNRDNATSLLNLEETSLDSITSLIQDVQTQIVQAGDAAYDDSQRKDIATALRERLSELVGLANATDGEGNYMFSGYKTSTVPFSQTGLSVSYEGDLGTRMLQVGAVREMAINDTGEDVFCNVTSNKLFVSTANASNTGGATVSPLAVVDSTKLTGHAYEIEYDLATNAYHVTDATLGTTIQIGATASPQTLSFDGLKMTITGTPTDTDTFNITDKFPVSAASPANTGGATVSPMSIANVAQLTGHEYQVTYDSTATPAYVVTDKTLGTTVTTTVTGATLSFDGLEMTLTGAPDNGDTFTVSNTISSNDDAAVIETGSQSIFGMLQDLITLLETPASSAEGKIRMANGLAQASTDFANALDRVVTVRATVGARLNELEALDNEGDNRDLNYAKSLSNLQDLDYVKAASDLAQQKITLEATQSSFASMMKLSLFNYI